MYDIEYISPARVNNVAVNGLLYISSGDTIEVWTTQASGGSITVLATTGSMPALSRLTQVAMVQIST